jgi:hypothetical protein
LTIQEHLKAEALDRAFAGDGNNVALAYAVKPGWNFTLASPKA